MAASPYFSIVMPVFRNRAYVAKAVDSALAQTFSDFELILVDDASPDGCGALCDAYAQRDDRVRVLHLPENVGAAGARNQGMAQAAGQYLFFFDSDDWIEPGLLQTAADSLQVQQAQMVVWGVTEEYFDAQGRPDYQTVLLSDAQTLTDQDTVRRAIIGLEERTLFGYPWNKVYELAFLRGSNVTFDPSYPINEDFAFNLALADGLERVNVLACAPYHYAKRDVDSLTSRFLPDYFALNTRRVRDLLEKYQAWGLATQQVRATLANIYVRYIFSALQRNCDPRAQMDANARRAWLSDLYEQPLFRELIGDASPENRLVKIMAALLEKRARSLCLATGRTIYLVKTKLPGLFTKARQNR